MDTSIFEYIDRVNIGVVQIGTFIPVKSIEDVKQGDVVVFPPQMGFRGFKGRFDAKTGYLVALTVKAISKDGYIKTEIIGGSTHFEVAQKLI